MNWAVSTHTRLLVLTSVPLTTHRALSSRPTATAQGLSQGFPSASRAPTLRATTLESTTDRRSEALSVSSRRLVAAAATAVSSCSSRLANLPSNRRLTTTIVGRGPPVCAPSAGPASTNSNGATTPYARTSTSRVVRFRQLG